MGAFIAYLHLAHGLNNFFVLAPNLTIYNKLITDFTQNTPKYVPKGIAEFAISPPVITTGENYERQIASGGSLFPTTINIFNISKIAADVRGGRTPRIRGFRKNRRKLFRLPRRAAGPGADHGQIAPLPRLRRHPRDHRAAARDGAGLTATPFVETPRSPAPFKNVVFDHPLAKAMEDGFVKEPAVVTRENFNPVGKSPEAIQQIKLEDGVRLRESVKVELETYARQSGERLVKPFILVIARDTAHAAELMRLVQSDGFFEGRYADKVIQVDSSVKEDETIERLLKVESPTEPTEIVIHVNMLKEGWESNMARYLFTGFRRCLYEVQKFQSDSERKLAVILELEALKWFKPVKGQFKLYYRSGIDELEYQPVFVAETEDAIFMLEPKASNSMDEPDVRAKQAVAEEWCPHASAYAATCEGKPWKYVLIPHDAIAENMTLEGLARAYSGKSDG